MLPGKASRGPKRGVPVKRCGLVFVIALLLSTGAAATTAPGPTTDDCLACHSDKSLSTKRGNRTVSLFVDQKKFAGSIHGSLQCTSCHADLDVKDLRSSVAAMKVPFVCGQCHQEGTPVQANRNIGQHDILENYTESIHGEG